MSWFPIAIIAQIILGTSAVFDKMLLKRSIFNPLAYTFWLGVLGVFALVLLPFSSFAFSITTIGVALVAGALFLLAMYFLFASLHKGEASKSLLLIGGLTPVTTLLTASFILHERLSIAAVMGFGLLVTGGFVLFIFEKKELRKSIALLACASAIFFGLSNVLSKHVFLQGAFVEGFFWIKLGGVFLVLLFLANSSVRTKIFSSLHREHAEHHKLYLLNRGYAAAGSVLVNVAIFLAHPALVESTQSIKYAVIFIAAWFLLGEHFKGKVLAGKLIALFLIGVGFAWIALADFAHNIPVDAQRSIVWGATFSQKFSRELGLDWKENFTALLGELKPRAVRLVAYWDDIEKEQGAFDFSETDWLLEKASLAGTRVVFAVGMKAPRWPECHIPQWAKELDTEKREEVLRTYLTAVIEQYRDNPAIGMWQVENEPYLAFGDCPERGVQFLEKEVALVKSLDPTRLILTTDGGEFGLWYKAARNGDAFGTTMYRKVYPKIIGPKFGVVEYPLAPSFFRFKEKVVRRILGDWQKPFMVIELQAEPWGPKHILALTNEEQEEIFGPEYFKKTIEYAKETGFSEYYLWGSEWWYWKKMRGDARYWDIAKELFTTKDSIFLKK
ncbi:EamA family transporter [Candidatus Azambacteria bacterium]|nr:EamA family transporter [Candidatus Azambacteria bacterium]